MKNGRGNAFEWTEQRVRRLRAMIASETPSSQIALSFGVSRAVVSEKVKTIGIAKPSASRRKRDAA